MADGGSWLSMKDNLDLTVLLEGDSQLYNPYGVIAMNPATQEHVRYIEAMVFIAWVMSK